MEHIIITGATGFLGRNLCQCFLNRGDCVWVLVRPESTHLETLPTHKNLKIVRCAMEQVLDCVGEIGHGDAWFHFAWGGVNRAEIDSPEVQKSNICGSLDCIRAAHLLQCKVFVDAGSRVEYGITGELMQEDMVCNPVNEYGKAKLSFFEKASKLCKEYSLSYVHLRFFSVYGYGDHPWSIISTLIRELGKNQDVSLSACLHEWNFMYIADAVEAVVRLYDHVRAEPLKAPVAVNVASCDTRILKSFVEETKEIIGGTGEPHYGTFAQAKEGALSIRPSIDRLTQMTDGWSERYTFREGITETIKKEMEHKDEENKRTDSLL